jgi:hypothetical protein
MFLGSGKVVGAECVYACVGLKRQQHAFLWRVIALGYACAGGDMEALSELRSCQQGGRVPSSGSTHKELLVITGQGHA